ncbi:MAG: hypothetical protein N2Z20_02625 [Elusimicrobiales bacterium]|nr:hypothetical protein [Elusimicrobiales bacterium]
MKKNIFTISKDFLSKPEEFIKDSDFKTILCILLINSIIKVIYNIISSHPFPPEMNFEFSGIVNPTITDFILSYIISEFLYLGIFLSVMTILISEKFFIKTSITIFILALSIYSIFKGTKLILILYLTLVIFILFIFTKKNIKNYITSFKILISIHIIGIISTILIYFAELLYSNILFMTILFIYSILSFGYFVKLFVANYDISVKKLIMYSIIAAIITISFGISLTKIDIFSSNTKKLILYN